MRDHTRGDIPAAILSFDGPVIGHEACSVAMLVYQLDDKTRFFCVESVKPARLGRRLTREYGLRQNLTKNQDGRHREDDGHDFGNKLVQKEWQSLHAERVCEQ